MSKGSLDRSGAIEQAAAEAEKIIEIMITKNVSYEEAAAEQAKAEMKVGITNVKTGENKKMTPSNLQRKGLNFLASPPPAPNNNEDED